MGLGSSQYLIKCIHQVTSSLLPNIFPLWFKHKAHFLTSVSPLTYLLAFSIHFHAFTADTLTADFIKTQFSKYGFPQRDFGHATNSLYSHSLPLPHKISRPPLQTSSFCRCRSLIHPTQSLLGLPLSFRTPKSAHVQHSLWRSTLFLSIVLSAVVWTHYSGSAYCII